MPFLSPIRRPFAALSAVGMLVALLVAGCGSLVGVEAERQIGAIDYYGQPMLVAVPDTVRAGAAFDITVVTYGDGCLTEDGTEVALEGPLAQAVPYDRRTAAGSCSDALRSFEHRATLRFDEAGDARVRIVGKRMPGNQLIVVSRPVVVEPASVPGDGDA